jgi:hypothetical protein
MPTVAELQLVLTARDEASKHLQGLGRDVARLEKQVESTSGAFGRMGGLLGGLGGIGLAAGGVGAIVSGFQGAIGAVGGLVAQASDLNEQLSRSQQIFGAASESVQRFAQTSGQSLGIARAEALQMAGNFGQLLRTSGLTEDAAADMSQRLLRLGADLASFNNLEVGDSLAKLRSGLAGEAEPLRELGVLLSEDAVQAEALSLGLVQGAVDATKARAAAAALTEAQVKYNAVAREANATAAQRERAAAAVQTAEAALNKVLAGSIPALTEAQKVQARYSLILKQTATAQGDFARTSTSLANAQRIIRASWTDLSATLGTAFLPAVARAASFLATEMPRALALVERATESLGPALAALFSGDLQGALDRAVALVGAAGAALAPQLATWTRAFLQWVQEAAPRLLEGLEGLAGDVWAWIREQAPTFLETLVGQWTPAFLKWVTETVPPLLVELGRLLGEIGKWVLSTGIPELQRLGHDMGVALAKGLQTALVTEVPRVLAEGIRVDVGAITVQASPNPVETARRVGEQVAASVLQALQQSAAATDPGASPSLQGSGR